MGNKWDRPYVPKGTHAEMAKKAKLRKKKAKTSGLKALLFGAKKKAKRRKR